MTYLNLVMRAASLAAGMLLIAGCPDKGAETDTDSGSATDADPTTGGATTTATDGVVTGETPTTTDDGGTMGGTQGATEGTTASEPTTTDPGTTTGGTTGGGSAEFEASCAAACDKLLACPLPPPIPPLFPDLESCVAECVASVDPGADPACFEATAAANNCFAGFTCDQLVDAFVNEELGECTDEQEAADAVCLTCESFGSDGPNGCSIGLTCPGLATEEYVCEGDTCTCVTDGIPGATCPADDFCSLDFDAQRAAGLACCGVEF